jgi:Homeodomain-like domain
VLRDLDQRRLTTDAAAQLLRLERRQVFRLLKAYRIAGAAGLISKRPKEVRRNFLIPKYRLAIRHFITICLMVYKNRKKHSEKIAELYCGWESVFPINAS